VNGGYEKKKRGGPSARRSSLIKQKTHHSRTAEAG
jgi:hypothetical protein